MPKFLTGCHYNEQEINQHLKERKKRYWLVQMNDNKFATGQILEKPVEVVKGRILAEWAQKSPRTLKWVFELSQKFDLGRTSNQRTHHSCD